MKRDGRRVQVVKEGRPVSVGKRVAPASSLFHPPATLLPACCSVQRGGRRGQRGRKKGTRAGRGGGGKQERGCRTPIRSIAAFSPCTFTTP